MYKITRVRGRYLKVADERSRTPSVFSLVEDEENPRWRWLYETGHRLRFVDAVYGNTVFTYPSVENVFEILCDDVGVDREGAGGELGAMAFLEKISPIEQFLKRKINSLR